VRGPRYVVDADLALLESAAGVRPAPRGPGAEPALPAVAFLAPLDPLVWDRDLLRRLYDFDYVWEVYVPEAKRRWGYYVLPLLYGDRLVGRIEPRIDRRAGILRVLDVWWEAAFDPLVEPAFADALTDALVAHARFGGVTRIALPRTARHRGLADGIRARLGPRGTIRA
jgi:uncharacterized protein YcaQ